MLVDGGVSVLVGFLVSVEVGRAVWVGIDVGGCVLVGIAVAVGWGGVAVHADRSMQQSKMESENVFRIVEFLLIPPL
jgi:uncharacterized membrane protein